MQRKWRAGGHYQTTHTDVGAIQWLQSIGCSSLLDVGAGPGGMVRLARSVGMTATGIDADRTITDGDCVRYGKAGIDAPEILAEVVWSVETAEHIAEDEAPNYATYLRNCATKYILITANDKPGPWHCNVKPLEYWRNLISNDEWHYSDELTNAWKQHSTMQREFVRETGLAFEKGPSSA